MPFLIVMLFASLATASVAGAQVPLELTRITSPILVDGVLSDEAWRDVAPLPLTMYLPVYRGVPTQRSEIRVAYDEQYFYAGGWFYDSDPKGIRINSLYRDRWNGDDALAIYIDAFNDDQNAKWFGITAAGMRFDQLVYDDGNTLNDNWDGFWEAKTTVTDEGWFVEVKIPFSTIGFQVDAAGRAIMGLTVTRLVSRLNERVTFPAIDPKFPFRRPSSAQDVMLRGVTSPTPFYLTPYLLAGSARTPFTGTDVDREIGVDARYPFSPNFTLDLTANTDFAQVEADDQQVALDRFPLFFPERRRFFQENAGLFDFVTAGGGRAISFAPNRPHARFPAGQDFGRCASGRARGCMGCRRTHHADGRHRHASGRELRRGAAAAQRPESVFDRWRDGDHLLRRGPAERGIRRRHVAAPVGR